jgi:YhcH/YjgK/YiaL family protein
MILDTLSNAETYIVLHTGFKKAFGFLRRDDLDSLNTGKHQIEGDNVYALIQKGAGKLREDALLEAHRSYIDIQFLIDGNERTGWKSRGDCRTAQTTYNDERDIEFFSDQPQTYLVLSPAMFAIFFPGDAHAPMISDGPLHKCVVKVRIR